MKSNIWIDKVVLWPVNQCLDPRIVKFKNNSINIIYGDSRTGKSALIPIIDYCLCSGDCRIPIGVIRECTSWYGIVHKDAEGEVLLCRAEPGSKRQTSEMYLEMGVSLSIPGSILKNTTSGDVKDFLNQRFGFSAIPSIDQGRESPSRVSFRDAVAVLYQPQNIIANPEALFYKLDTMEHKTRFSKMFPYLVGAITSSDLVNKLELDNISAEIKRIRRDAGELKKVSATWERSAEGTITRAIELGISDYNLDMADSFDDLIAEIEQISSLPHSAILKRISREGAASETIAQLAAEEAEHSKQKADISRRLRKIDEALLSCSRYGETVKTLSEYAGITDWLLARTSTEKQCPVCGQEIRDVGIDLENLRALSNETCEADLDGHMQLELTKERAALSAKLHKVNEELNAISTELRLLEESQNTGRFQLSEIERFIGELKASLGQYRAISHDPSSQERLTELTARKMELENILSAVKIGEKTRRAIETISSFTKNSLELLDVENSDWKTYFNHRDMTLQIQDQAGINRFLNEIGSASNWLSYHVAFSLAIQRYIQGNSPLTVPGFLFYDQPSQVYFPHEADLRSSNRAELDRDKEAVRKIFATFDEFIKLDNLQFQIIVTEHAGGDIWGGLQTIHEVEHWTRDGEKLIPDSWIKPTEIGSSIDGNE